LLQLNGDDFKNMQYPISQYQSKSTITHSQNVFNNVKFWN